jgi:carbamoyl-phosphate synthase / aspartate carbamoyltransferase / dihydroorotase
MYLNHTFTTLRLETMDLWWPHFRSWPLDSPICVHAEGHTMGAVLFLAATTGRRVHICHVSRKDEIEMIREAKRSGVRVPNFLAVF